MAALIANCGQGGNQFAKSCVAAVADLAQIQHDIFASVAERFVDELTQRLADFALQLNLDKTRLIEFGRHAATNRKVRGLGKPEVFDFLGFTHICGRSRKGRFQLRRQSRRDRLRAKLREIRETLWQHRHAPMEEQGSWLRHVVTGWFAYHAVPVNGPSLRVFRDGVICIS